MRVMSVAGHLGLHFEERDAHPDFAGGPAREKRVAELVQRFFVKAAAVVLDADGHGRVSFLDADAHRVGARRNAVHRDVQNVQRKFLHVSFPFQITEDRFCRGPFVVHFDGEDRLLRNGVRAVGV